MIPFKARIAGPTRPALLVMAGLVVGLGGCSVGNLGAPEPLMTPVVQNNAPDSRGVISYASYQVIVAREGDTMASVAARVGISAEDLARRNALPVTYNPRDGEVLLLPDSVARTTTGGFDTGEVTTASLAWSPERASAAIDGASPTPQQQGQTDPQIDPVRHRVEAGETAYSIARLYGVSVTALASWNGLGPDLVVRTGQELLIPIVSSANRIATTSETQPGQGTAVPPPPSATDPLPEDTDVATDPGSPDLGQFRTPPGGRLSPPVAASVTRSFSAANPNGVGYAVPAGTPVNAAGDGEVALISEELGGQGTIVLIRHRDDLMTTYSTLSNVTVSKGDTVRAGQPIGSVAPRANPELQFDVFRGTTAVDPTPYVSGG